MRNAKILDCTLRDGGYINNWEFGESNIRRILYNLNASELEIVEVGFLSNKVDDNKNSTRFSSINNIINFLPHNRNKTEYVCMINYGEYNLQDLPECSGRSVTGIRVAFHKKDLEKALDFCNGVSKKGYKLFIQPMVSVSYTDVEFINLIKKSNDLNPYAFYIVDSFGVMKRDELMRLFYVVDRYLGKDSHVGYHSHNNLQLSYSNAQMLVELKTKRELIIDSSVFGMGRGAGNLNTELFVEYLNDVYGSHYKINPLLKIIDDVLNNIYKNNYWGYSLPHYISAKHNCHPNYATYLSSKDTLTIEDISNILMTMDEANKVNYSQDYIDNLYINYQTHKINDSIDMNKLREIFYNKNVVALAPGASISHSEKIIKDFSKHRNTITVSINFKPKRMDVNYIFISNLKRFEQLNINKIEDLIVTSNVTAAKDVAFRVNYVDLLVENSVVRDNAGLMLIKLLLNLGVKSIQLAGYDGYSYDANENYVEENLALVKQKSTVDDLNNGMIEILSSLFINNNIHFITKTKYTELNNNQFPVT